jgi:hypothetical protein
MVAGGQFPTRDNCDSTNPEEAFLWMFAALPGVRGAPLIMPVTYYREVSKRLWDLGCRPAEEPTLEWVPPTASDANWITSPGRWVPAGSSPKPSQEDQAKAAIVNMTSQQKFELLASLSSGEPCPETPSGLVCRALSDKQREVVLLVLREEAAGDNA